MCSLFLILCIFSFCYLFLIIRFIDLTIPSNEQAIHKLYKAIHQILLLRLNHTEIACLKTLILFRPGECFLSEIFQFFLFHHILCEFSSSSS